MQQELFSLEKASTKFMVCGYLGNILQLSHVITEHISESYNR